MAVCYVTGSSSLDADLVLDSRFYDPQKLSLLKSLKKDSRNTVRDLFTEIRELVSKTTKLKFPVTVFDLNDTLANLFSDGEEILSMDDLGSSKKTAIVGDLAVSRLRHYLKEIGIVPLRKHPALLSSEYVVLRELGDFPAAALMPYLLSDQVQYIFAHAQRGSNHPRLANKDILDLPLPDSLIKIKQKISSLVTSATSDYEFSKKLYPEAENELLDRMKWGDVSKKHKLNYSISQTFAIEKGRFDAEFYQPKFKNLERHIKKMGALRLGEFCPPPIRGAQPEYTWSGNILVINSKHLGRTEIDINGPERTTEEFFLESSNEKARLSKFDVLMYSTGAYIGRTNVYLDSRRAIASNHVTIIRPDSRICNPTYLALFLNSPAGLMQTDQRASGSGQREIYPENISEYLIFLPQNKNGKADLLWQNKLAEKVVAANESKNKARENLQKAQRIVEKAILKLT